MNKPTIICLTPVRNEAWILDRFLKAASLWANYIIIADQMSTDGSREIAKKFEKVILIDNECKEFNEPERQKLLINEARKIDGPRLLVTLDADEIFSPELFETDEWNNILAQKPGTIIKFQWANILPGFKKYWLSDFLAFGFMDDGQDHSHNTKIHSVRIPIPENPTNIEATGIKVLHLQYTNWKRMKSKHRYYQCLELSTYPQKSPLDIFRIYHHMYALKNKKLKIPINWLKKYELRNINLKHYEPEKQFWYDEEILKLLDKHSSSYFRKIAIWNINWHKKAREFKKTNSKSYNNPQSILDRIIYRYLFLTQKWINKSLINYTDRKIKRYFNY